MRLLRGETPIVEAADWARGDCSIVMNLRKVARQGALAASRLGVKANGVDPEPADARAEMARLSESLKETGHGQ